MKMMKLTVSLNWARRAADAIDDLGWLSRELERICSNVWIGPDDDLADEVTALLSRAGIPEDEYTIEF